MLISLDRLKNRKVPSVGEMTLVLYYRGKCERYKSNTKMSEEWFLKIHRAKCTQKNKNNPISLWTEMVAFTVKTLIYTVSFKDKSHIENLWK